MIKLVINRLLYSFAVLLGVITVVFLLFIVLPGDPTRMIMGQRADVQSLEAIKKDLGLDLPVSIQYLKYLNDLSPVSLYSSDKASRFGLANAEMKIWGVVDFPFSDVLLVLKPCYLRRSYQSRKPVVDIIKETIPNTFILAITAMFFATLLGIFLGIAAAIKKDKLFDKIALLLSSFGMSIPSFFAAILIGWLFAFVLADYTGLNLTGNLTEIDDFGDGERMVWKNLILPALTLGIRPLAIILQLSRNSMLEVLQQDYIRTAHAKGLSFSRIILVHALKNSLNPVITAVSGWFASLMAGVVFIEYIFGWKGLGYVIVEALNMYDLPVVMGTLLVISTVFVLLNFLVDIGYGVLDPKIRHR